MNNIVITGDSTCDLSPELRERYNISILPLGVTLGDKTFKDGVDIVPDDIYAHHAKTGELPKTTAANVGECIDFFKPFVDDGKTVIHFTISSSMSSTYSNACLAAEEFENVYVIDCANLSTGSGLLVINAAEMAMKGIEAKEIVEKIEKMKPCVDASFVIDSLEYLHKGGRCSALAMLGANLLKLKPCIEVKNGAMGVGKKYRGKFAEVLMTYTKERIGDGSDIDLDRIFVTHAGCDTEIVQSVVDLVKELAPFKEVFLTRAGCTVSSHCGANTLGVLFVRKHPVE
ncbi:MAG: DegV family protein [Clostridia bacterium]|nr:DegV family protein [Clostridia bacterium]MEE1055061.1 DegV family protein [Acutalibacteraceae bacterium]